MKRILTSIWFLALIVTIPVIIWLPPVFDKYKAEQIKLKYNTSLNMRLYFKDLDSDGTKEEIKSYEDFSGRFAIQYFKQDKVVPIDQLNFSNAFNPVLNKIYFDDLNKDGYTELYVFLTRSDSLFLHWFQPYPNRMNHEEVKFITKLGTYNNGLLDARIHDVYFKDLDQDGFNEIYCALDNGYSIWPRSIFRIDLRNNTITQSPDDGINDYKLEFEDLDGDGQTDIIVDNSAGANIKDEAGNLHTDNFTWLVAYNANFDALFPPIRFTEGLNNYLYNFVVGDQEKNILTFHFNENLDPIAMLYSINRYGEKTDSLVLPEYHAGYRHYIRRISKDRFWLLEGNHLTEISSDMQIIETQVLPVHESSRIVFVSNIYGDKTQILFSDFYGRSLMLLLDNQKHTVTIPFEHRIGSITKWNFYAPDRFFVLDEKNVEYHFEIQKNKLYYLKFPVYALIYLFIVLFIWVLQQARIKQLQEKYRLREQVQELKLKTFRNQLNPHFIFNTFNGVASVIKNGDNEKAYEVFIRFSKLLRNTLDNFDHTHTSLKKEIEQVTNFIELQKFRFKDRFEYKIRVSRKLHQIQIPRMIIQIHVENAIKHGLLPKRGNGKLLLSAERKEKYLEIIIEDNGIGRTASQNNGEASPGIGLKTIGSLIEEINTGNKHKIRQTIEDLTDDEHQAIGTRVTVLIPMEG